MIKVCGMRNAQNIKDVEALGIDWMGFIFWPSSKRFCKERPTYLPTKCKKVGVFVNASVEEVAEKCKEFGLDLVQLHGNEDRAYVVSLRRTLAENEVAPMIIKALALKTKEDLKKCDEFVGFVDYFLFDTPSAGYGGTGQKFDWSLLDAYCLFTPFLLSGGIGPDSIEALKDFQNPFCVGFDLNSKFEIEPGLKNVEALKSFIEALPNPRNELS